MNKSHFETLRCTVKSVFALNFQNSERLQVEIWLPYQIYVCSSTVGNQPRERRLACPLARSVVLNAKELRLETRIGNGTRVLGTAAVTRMGGRSLERGHGRVLRRNCHNSFEHLQTGKEYLQNRPKHFENLPGRTKILLPATVAG